MIHHSIAMLFVCIKNIFSMKKITIMMFAIIVAASAAIAISCNNAEATNTSDETGIGRWKFEQFKKAIREGKSKGLDGNRPLMPPMPWTQYRNLSDDDLRDIFAFLKSTKPIKNLVPQPIPPDELKYSN